MARSYLLVMLSVLLILGSLPFAVAVPDVDEDTYWWMVEDEVGDEAENCQRFDLDPTDDSRPNPCDIVSLEIGNTETHFIYRLGLATAEFGATGQFGHVQYTTRLQGNIGEEDGFTTVVRLDNEGLSLEEVQPAEWEGSVEADVDGDKIIISMPLADMGSIFMGAEAAPHTSWVNVSSVQSHWEFVTDVDSPKLGDFIELNGDETYVIQPSGSLSTPEIDPVVFQENLTGDSFEAAQTFSTGPPKVDDPCVPWNATCFLASQPVTAQYVYQWELGLPTVEFSFSQQIVNGTADLVVIDDFDIELFRITSGEAVDEEVLEVISPVQTEVLYFVVELDRFEGSFEISAKEGPPLGDGGGGDGDGDGDGGDGDGGDGDGGNGDGDGSDLEESGGIPGPGVVVLLAVLAGLVSLTRRR